jgi:hypothetical protein
MHSASSPWARSSAFSIEITDAKIKAPALDFVSKSSIITAIMTDETNDIRPAQIPIRAM